MNPKTRKPSLKSGERAESQRQRILKAAKECFVEDGLHAGTIARISESAQMSPGLIYRYFSSREEIVVELAQHEISSNSAVSLVGLAPKVFAARFCEYLRRWRAGDPEVLSATLILELSAEGTRNEAIARQITEVDTQANTSLTAWLSDLAQKSGKPLNEEELAISVLTLQGFLDGLLLRAVRESALDIDASGKALENLIALLVPPQPTTSM
ncbi:TetR family transcriptional regulator [Variovorax paradoxus]|uniref:TetR family transcriptional regulator n=1 Tax=Variovorax TaxID=34072 RepID=UPI001ABD1E44